MSLDRERDPVVVAQADQSQVFCRQTAAKLMACVAAMLTAKHKDDAGMFALAEGAYSHVLGALDEEKLIMLVGHLIYEQIQQYVQRCGGTSEFIARVEAKQPMPCLFCGKEHDEHPHDPLKEAFGA